MGREYDTNAFHKETVAFAADWAKRMRLTDPLPEGIDFTEFEDKEIQNQVRCLFQSCRVFRLIVDNSVSRLPGHAQMVRAGRLERVCCQ